MLTETTPHDGGRRNLLNDAMRHLGIALALDSTSTVWMTIDVAG